METYDRIVGRLDALTAETDRSLRTIAEAIADHQHPEIEELATHVIGPRRSELAGGGRDTSQGFEGRLRDLEKGQGKIRDLLSNGVVKTRLGYRDRIYVALIGGGALLGSALIAAVAGVAR